MEVLKEIKAELVRDRKDVLEGLTVRGGDILWVQYRDHINSVRFKTYQGVCVSVVKTGFGLLCTLRSSIGGVSVDYRFHSLSKNIRQVKKVRDRARIGGRAKLY